MKVTLLAQADTHAEKVVRPLFLSRVQAGFPSPAEGEEDRKLDLNRYLIENAPATFFVRVEGESMKEAGILSGDVLVVDKSKEAQSGDIVVAVVEGEFTVKAFLRNRHGIFLMPYNSDFEPIQLTEESEAEIWGVVVGCVRKM